MKVRLSRKAKSSRLVVERLESRNLLSASPEGLTGLRFTSEILVGGRGDRGEGRQADFSRDGMHARNQHSHGNRFRDHHHSLTPSRSKSASRSHDHRTGQDPKKEAGKTTHTPPNSQVASSQAVVGQKVAPVFSFGQSRAIEIPLTQLARRARNSAVIESLISTTVVGPADPRSIATTTLPPQGRSAGAFASSEPAETFPTSLNPPSLQPQNEQASTSTTESITFELAPPAGDPSDLSPLFHQLGLGLMATVIPEFGTSDDEEIVSLHDSIAVQDSGGLVEIEAQPELIETISLGIGALPGAIDIEEFGNALTVDPDLLDPLQSGDHEADLDEGDDLFSASPINQIKNVREEAQDEFDYAVEDLQGLLVPEVEHDQELPRQGFVPQDCLFGGLVGLPPAYETIQEEVIPLEQIEPDLPRIDQIMSQAPLMEIEDTRDENSEGTEPISIQIRAAVPALLMTPAVLRKQGRRKRRRSSDSLTGWLEGERGDDLQG